jgi:hypothetical protein
VILFHAGLKTFSGGFIGVDVFFVISGYLITSIILHDQHRNKFSLLCFRGIYLTPPYTTGCGLTKVANGTGPTCTAC